MGSSGPSCIHVFTVLRQGRFHKVTRSIKQLHGSKWLLLAWRCSEMAANMSRGRYRMGWFLLLSSCYKFASKELHFVLFLSAICKPIFENGFSIKVHHFKKEHRTSEITTSWIFHHLEGVCTRLLEPLQWVFFNAVHTETQVRYFLVPQKIIPVQTPTFGLARIPC